MVPERLLLGRLVDSQPYELDPGLRRGDRLLLMARAELHSPVIPAEAGIQFVELGVSGEVAPRATGRFTAP